MKQKLIFTRNLLKQTFTEFSEDRPLDWAANIGFYTIFSLPAILIIMIRIAGAVFGKEAVQGEVVSQFGSVVGRSSAEQIQSIIENANTSSSSTVTTILGIATLLFASTTVFISKG
ncbi:MAG: YihY/virulence factor BrkB family protein [Hymenobacteraceae bacterium]|nr:YihY/virulence factor BrkB family protein [Hymenobacteraceae bacterium]MDX5395450.1 YihY/virulence factor BrkB family protein [Hymenobacteraceae bacterium]MDX5511499.1 YihY/virulence factor BrkB family protein [Hymenobacteraceae bacterium]